MQVYVVYAVNPSIASTEGTLILGAFSDEDKASAYADELEAKIPKTSHLKILIGDAELNGHKEWHWR